MICFSVVTGYSLPQQGGLCEEAITRAGHGVLGGYGEGSSLVYVGSWGYCWSSTYTNTGYAYYLYFGSNGSINPQYANYKYYGLAVRCVKDSEKRLKAGRKVKR